MKLSTHDLVFIFLCVAVLLAVAKILGETVRKFGQPAVIGELIAGILLGPTLLGTVAPELATQLIPKGTPGALFLSGFSQFAVVMFLDLDEEALELALERPLGRGMSGVLLRGLHGVDRRSRAFWGVFGWCGDG